MWPPSTPEPSDACPPDKLPNCNTEASQFEDDFTPFIDSRSSLQTPAEEEEELDDFDSLTRMIGQLQAARTHALSLGDDDGKRREFAEAATRRFLRQFEDDHV